MTDKFLIAGGVAGNISNGTISIYGSKIGAKNLDPSRSIKTDSQGRLQTVNLDIADINTLQSQLNSKIGNPFLGTLNVTDLETNEYFSLNDELDNIQYISKSLGLTTISSNILSNDVACSSVLNQISSTRIDMTSPTSIDIQATNFTFNGEPIGGISNPLTSNLVGDGFEIQNIGKITINQTVPFVDVLEINGKFKQSSPNTVVYNMYSERVGGVGAGSIIGMLNFNAYDNTNTSNLVSRISCNSLGTQTTTNKGCDYIISSTLSNQTVIGERLKISGDGTTYITGGLDITDDLNMNNNNIVDIGLANYNLETSLLDLTTKTQNIAAFAGYTEILGGVNQKLGVSDSFNISDDSSPFSLLKFNVSNTDILSQIKHVFSNGLETSLNGIGSIGTALKKFSGIWVNQINGLSPIGGVYMATSNSALISSTTIEKSLIDSPTFEGSLTIPAGTFQISSYHFNVAGEVSTNNGDTLTLRLKNGGEISSIVVDLTGSSNEYFEFEGDFSIEAIGGLGVARISNNFDFTYSDTGSSLRGKRICVVNNTTFDTTVSNTLDLTAQWSSTNANNSIQSFQAVLTKTY